MHQLKCAHIQQQQGSTAALKTLDQSAYSAAHHCLARASRQRHFIDAAHTKSQALIPCKKGVWWVIVWLRGCPNVKR